MGTGNNSRIIGSFQHHSQVFKSGNKVHTAMLEVTQVSQASGSNAVGPSASVTVDDEAVPGLFISRDAMLSSTCNHREKAESNYQPPPHGKRRSAVCGTFDPNLKLTTNARVS